MELEAVNRAIRSGAITDQDIRNAYFRGDTQAIAKITDAVHPALDEAKRIRSDRWAGENAKFKSWLINGPPPRANQPE